MSKKIEGQERIPIREWSEEERRMAIIARMTANRTVKKKDKKHGGE
jgi:hypothetical protein